MSGEKRYFLDTNALVAFGNGEESIGNLLSSADAVATSVICELEYLSWDGLTEQETKRFREFLSLIEVVDVKTANADLKNRIVEIRKANTKIKLPDAIVMASAAFCESVLLTRDDQLLKSGLCEMLKF